MDYATWPLQIKEKSYASDTNRTHLEKRNHQLDQRKRSEKAERSQCEKAKKVTRRPEEGERGGKQVNVIPPFILTLNEDPQRPD